MKFVSPNNKHREDKQGYSKKILLNEKELNNPGSHLQYVKIDAGQTAASHYHKIQTEIFYFLDENGYWIINDTKVYPKKGDVIVIEPNDKHTVIAYKDADYVYIAFKIAYDSRDLYWD